MLKIKELLQVLIETQKQINTSIKELKEDLKPKYQTLTTTMSDISNWKSCIETNIYTKEQTIQTINKEYDYRKKYEECLEKNEPLLKLIENYCKYDDKYKVIDLFATIDAEYDIKRKVKE